MAANEETLQKAEIIERRDYAADLWSMRIRPEQRLIFQPGQYTTLAVEEGAQWIARPYSIVSSPLEDDVEFFFELVPGGGLTPALHKMRVGETLWMHRGAKGEFTLDSTSSHQQHFLVATVTGVAPFVSMVRTLAREAKQGRRTGFQLAVLHAASRPWEFGYREELEGLAREWDWLHHVPTVSRPWEDPSWKGEVGRIEDVLRKYLDAFGLEPSGTTAYLCGHPQMIENAKAILRRKGFREEFIRQEVYWIPKGEEK